MGASETNLLDLVKYQIGKISRNFQLFFFERRKLIIKK